MWLIFKKGVIRIIELSNNRYDYDAESVYILLNKDFPRKTYLYARVSKPKQKKDLQNQIELLKSWCFQNEFQISGIYSDIASGISYENHTEFFKLLDEVLNSHVE